MERLRVPAIALAVALALAACGSGSAAVGTSSAADVSEIHLAVVGPLSGPAAADGQRILDGATLARDEINGAGGIAGGPYRAAHIAIDALDDGGSADRSVALAHQVVDSSPDWAVVGTSSDGAAIATAPVLDAATVTYLVTGATAQVSTGYQNVFVVPAAVTVPGPLRARYRARFHTDAVPETTARTWAAVLAVARALQSGPADRTRLGAALHQVRIAGFGAAARPTALVALRR